MRELGLRAIARLSRRHVTIVTGARGSRGSRATSNRDFETDLPSSKPGAGLSARGRLCTGTRSTGSPDAVRTGEGSDQFFNAAWCNREHAEYSLPPSRDGRWRGHFTRPTRAILGSRSDSRPTPPTTLSELRERLLLGPSVGRLSMPSPSPGPDGRRRGHFTRPTSFILGSNADSRSPPRCPTPRTSPSEPIVRTRRRPHAPDGRWRVTHSADELHSRKQVGQQTAEREHAEHASPDPLLREPTAGRPLSSPSGRDADRLGDHAIGPSDEQRLADAAAALTGADAAASRATAEAAIGAGATTGPAAVIDRQQAVAVGAATLSAGCCVARLASSVGAAVGAGRRARGVRARSARTRAR